MLFGIVSTRLYTVSLSGLHTHSHTVFHSHHFYQLSIPDSQNMSLYSLPKHLTSVLFSSLNKLKFLWIWEIFSHCPYHSFYSKKHVLTSRFHLFTHKGMEPTAFQYSTPAGRKLKAWKATETHMPDKLHSPCRIPFLLKKPLFTLSIHCTPLGYTIFCLSGRKPYFSLHSLHSYTVSPHMSNRFLVSIFRRAKVGNHFFLLLLFIFYPAW